MAVMQSKIPLQIIAYSVTDIIQINLTVIGILGEYKTGNWGSHR
jgi:hypothetical protein